MNKLGRNVIAVRILHADRLFVDLDEFLNIEGMGVEDEYGKTFFAVSGGIDCPRQRLECIVFGNSGGFQRHTIHVLGILVNFLDGTAVHGVMEMKEADIAPSVRKFFGRVLLAAECTCENGVRFCRSQLMLRAADAVLDRRNGRITAGSMVLQIVVMFGNRCTACTDGIKEIGEVREGHLDFGMCLLVRFDQFDVTDGRTAAVVADTVEQRKLVKIGLRFAVQKIDAVVKILGRIETCAVRVENTVSQNGRTVGCDPVKHIGIHRLFGGRRTHEDVAVHAALFEDLRQICVMTEGVNVIADLGSHAELFLEVTLCVEALTCKAFTGGQVAVGLNVPAADNDKTTFCNTRLDFLEHFLVKFFNPAVYGCGRADKLEVREFLHTVQCGTDGCLCFRRTFLPSPLPDRIQMGIAHGKNFGFVFHEGSPFLYNHILNLFMYTA